ncbi:ACT domain-containing protein [Acetanaerobacterium sp. MSJ-12]|uniref:UPF0237 protein GT747_01515 n=1 Tax=Bittarella massiliensis (ex Durand et al. 2017) TaxID=1720313 RepID=A0AAQ1MCD4_9FIRM|nr:MULTISPECIES: ACT domain-containing protein [Eubacteriales]MCB5941828.1 ACT domain-containing protein [bacterium 210820-DFI.6.52]ERI99480.1 ACT domain protein [Clostridium sp. ATCC 29733]MBU5420120.1 ACT domain-containing protein [Acetanaerobacterium sp. MSJ-12]MCQ4949895.1 ACT domain-containing protein [Bittarella massiliensis (ex Durand et al. 2017)]MZL68454.1 ACT domain-containing protein [Bittarella massiliensis (ex Durand et al. 2017)]
MKAVISVIGKDTVGILAAVSTVCAEANANVQDVTQSILGDIFAMIMVVDISKCNLELSELRARLETLGQERGLQINLMHEDIFNSMHRI